MTDAVRLRGNFESAQTDSAPSRGVWGECPIKSILEGTIDGIIFEDHFVDFPLIATQTTQINHGRYKVFNTGSGTVVPLSAVNSVELGGGILSIAVDTANDSGSIAQSYESFMLTGLTSNSNKLWFEGRLAFTPITTNGIGWFLGLAETALWTLATGVPFNAGDAITNSASAIGFRKEEDGLGVIDTVYSDRATSFTNIGDAETSVAANTFIKLGMIYDPFDATNTIRFFADGLELDTVMSYATLAALTNLDANALGLLFSVVADSAGTSGVAYLDWWRCVQIR